MDTNQSSLQPSHHKWYIYVIIVIAAVGIALVVGYLFMNSSTYQNKQEEAMEDIMVPTKIPGANIPLIKDAISEIPLLEEQSLAEPANAEVLRQKAHKYIIVDDLDNAASTYEQEMIINENDPALYKELGNVYAQLQETDKAITAYLKSIEIDPIDNNSYIDLADIYTVQQPNRDKVIETYTQAITANPTNTTFHILFAGFYEQIGEDQLALQQYQNVLAIDPNNVIAQNKIAQLLGK